MGLSFHKWGSDWLITGRGVWCSYLHVFADDLVLDWRHHIDILDYPPIPFGSQRVIKANRRCAPCFVMWQTQSKASMVQSLLLQWTSKKQHEKTMNEMTDFTTLLYRLIPHEYQAPPETMVWYGMKPHVWDHTMGVFDIKGDGIIYHHLPTLLKNRPRPFKKTDWYQCIPPICK